MLDLIINACLENKKIIVLKVFLFEMYPFVCFVLKVNTKLFEWILHTDEVTLLLIILNLIAFYLIKYVI